MPDREKPQPIFSLIQGGKTKPVPSGAQLFECKVCKDDIGVSTTTIIQVRRMAFLNKGKIQGGHKVWICATCLGRGKHTPVQ